MTGPGDEMAEAGGGHLRASHADREQAIEVLKAAFVQGRLAKDEFDLRTGQTFTARTHAELAAVTADIPAGVAAVQPPPTLARVQAQKPAGRVKAIGWGAGLIIPLAALGAVFTVAGHNVALFLLFVMAFVGATAVAWGAMIEARVQQRARGQLPRGPAPGAGGRTSRRTVQAAEADQLPQVNPALPDEAETASRRHPRPPFSCSRIPHLWHPRGRRCAVGYASH